MVDNKNKHRYNMILQDICKGKLNGKQIAEQYGVSTSYISQIKSRISQLRIPPMFVNDILVCSKCKKNKSQKLIIHHSHETGEQIAIICESCNHIVNDNNLEYREIKSHNGSIMAKVSITITDEMYDKIDVFCKKFHLTKSKYIRNLYNNFIFLYEFMEQYMVPDNKKNPAIDDLKKMKQLDEIKKWV